MDRLNMDACYSVKGWPGVAFWIDRMETVPDKDTVWTGREIETGRVLVVMIGDDKRHSVDLDDLEVLDELDYCHECGQVGCTHDGLDRG